MEGQRTKTRISHVKEVCYIRNNTIHAKNSISVSDHVRQRHALREYNGFVLILVSSPLSYAAAHYEIKTFSIKYLMSVKSLSKLVMFKYRNTIM